MANYKTPEDELSDLFLSNADQLDQFITGEAYTWGNNTFGSLGRGNSVSSLSPVQVALNNDWVDITAGHSTVVGIKQDGSLWAWGHASYGQLGNNSNINTSSPTLISVGWKQVSASETVLAIKQDGSLWAWGHGGRGTLGNNSTADRNSPVQTVAGGKNWKQVSAGNWHSGAIKDDGTLWLWGENSFGALGTLDSISRSSPIQTVATGNNWKYVSCGYRFTAAIKNDGTLWSWGLNDFGQLGTNNTTSTSSPVQTIAGGNNWKKVVAAYSGTYALKTDGSLWSWGDNTNGGVGDGTTTHRSSPVLIGTDYKDICESIFVSRAAIKNDGSLWAWGAATPNNTIGRGFGVGDGTNTHRSIPVQVMQVGTMWKTASYGWFQNAMIVVKD